VFSGSYKTNSPLLRSSDAGPARVTPVPYADPVTLAAFNAAPAEQAAAAMLACCAARRFAAAMTAGRPYPTLAGAELAVDSVFATLTWTDVLEAMDAHPRIGARVSGASAAEQSGVGDDTRAALAAGNAEYEQRFGYVYLICASGLSGEQLLAALRQRLGNEAAAERAVATDELRKITVLRVRKALAE
jgi:2-oxo-4-hydroxy-4-carboxy-5-ureidoimidazoline decarboxylase